MALSRKRQKELDRLKRSAQQLLDQQAETIDNATILLREARRQAGNYAREEVGPRVHDAYHGRVKPVIATGVAGARYAARTTKERFSDDVLPAVSSALGSAMAVLEAARDPRVRDVVRSASTRAGKAVGIAPQKKSGPGRYILIGLGVVAVASVAYAAWQTLRIDEDLWIEDVADADLGTVEDDEEF